jgi:hypothetical protein
VGELVDLSVAMSDDTTIASLGGLRWFISQGGGTLTGTAGNDGRGLFAAPPSGGPVTLVLKAVSGSNAGAIVASSTFTIVEPEGAQMVQQPGSGILHVNNTWSCAFLGDIFLRPTDVSFTNILMSEGSVAAVASGFLARLNGTLHDAGPLCSVGPGNGLTGCKVNIQGDTVVTGMLDPPYSDGDFVWDIPWVFTVGGSAPRTFTVLQHHATSDTVGTATISKGGAGPFSRVPSDPTTGF